MSFGQWHGFLRNLSVLLKDHETISDDWKSVYLSKKNNNWIPNHLFECVDNNITSLLKMDRKSLSENDEKGLVWKWLGQMLFLWNRMKNSIVYDLISPTSKLEIQTDADHEGSLIHLRNMMIHDQQIFLSGDFCEIYLPVVKTLVTGFTEKFLQIWENCIYDDCKKGWFLKDGDAIIPLSPFFEQMKDSRIHTNHLFILRSLNYKNGQLIYQGEVVQSIQKIQNRGITDSILSLLYPDKAY